MRRVETLETGGDQYRFQRRGETIVETLETRETPGTGRSVETPETGRDYSGRLGETIGTRRDSRD